MATSSCDTHPSPDLRTQRETTSQLHPGHQAALLKNPNRKRSLGTPLLRLQRLHLPQDHREARLHAHEPSNSRPSHRPTRLAMEQLPHDLPRRTRPSKNHNRLTHHNPTYSWIIHRRHQNRVSHPHNVIVTTKPGGPFFDSFIVEGWGIVCGSKRPFLTSEAMANHRSGLLSYDKQVCEKRFLYAQGDL